jgi:hypothetical protein
MQTRGTFHHWYVLNHLCWRNDCVLDAICSFPQAKRFPSTAGGGLAELSRAGMFITVPDTTIRANSEQYWKESDFTGSEIQRNFEFA